MKKLSFLLMIALLAVNLSAAAVPTVQEVAARIRPAHPRLFLTPEEMPTFGERVRTNPMFPEVKAYVDTLPEHPSLEIIPDIAKWEGDKIIFLRNVHDQNAVNYAFRYTGGKEAMCCTLMYFATGEERYRQMAMRYIRITNQFSAVAERSRILPEWYNTGRLCTIIAWDWLYNTMTPEERRELIAPLIKHIEFMWHKADFMRNYGSPTGAFYGEAPLRWYVGVAAYGEGIEEELVKAHFKNGYENHCKMMDFRDKCSAGSGVLGTITTGYSMAFFPYPSFHFLLTLQSAVNLDMTHHWTHMKDFDDFSSWMMIPDPTCGPGFLDFGWGDASKEGGNMLWFVFMTYNHMAQQIHLYGESAEARKIIASLPKSLRKFGHINHYSFLPFVLPRFNPEPPAGQVPKASPLVATHFSSYGLTVMRSGTDPDDTYASFKGGAWHDDHQHYDENSFIIYRKGFQALDTGTRGSAKHHLLYYAQTIAHNAMLIRGFQEPVAKHWYPQNAPRITETVYMDGGQNQRKVAKPLPFHTTDLYAICGGDATACYAKEKCKEAVRQFIYIKPDYFVVYDRVESVKADQDKVFLLHSIGEPAFHDGVWRSNNGKGSLFTRMLLPENHSTEIIGGEGREFVAGGVNYPSPHKDRGRGCLGKYRIEFTAPAQTESRFLTVMQAADQDEPKMIPCTLTQDKEYDTVSFSTKEGLNCTVSFRRHGAPGGILKITGNGIEPVEKRF